ncbi:MAG: TonB-dependent receptor [Deltaproteobacteria bacterium]|jgi:outer membrane receptor protein involved in Fe transport|nr:TonB-dependent receptor [Deltaproteobacteria bacterium]
MRFKFVFQLAMTLLFGIWFSAPSQALDATDADDYARETTLGEIEIRGIVRREELKSTSATVLSRENIEDRVYYQPLDMVYHSPGVSIMQYGEAGMSPQFQMRGFSARNDMAMYLDGVPLHDNGHAAGFTDSTVVIPIEIESVEIIKGPASVYYGARSSGGTIAVQSIKTGDFTKLNLRYGSWNDINAQGLIARQSEKLAQVYAFDVFHSDGYRANSDWDRKVASGRWTYNFSDKFQATLNIRAYHSEWDSAGYVSKKLNTTRGWVNDGSGPGQGNGGDRERYDARIWANYLITDESQLTYYLYGTTMEFTRYQRGDPTIYSISQNSWPNMTEQYNKHNQWGNGLTFNWKGQLSGREASFSSGVTYAKDMDEPRRTWSIPWGRGRSHVPGSKPSTETTFSLENPAIFTEFSYQALNPLTFRLGGRYDWLRGKHRNDLTGDRTSAKYKFFSPKAGIIYTPIESLELFANFGRGFSMPGGFNGSATGFFNDEANLKLSKRDQVEMGFRYLPLDWLGFEATAYQLKTYDESLTDPVTNISVQAGTTLREGLEFSLQATPVKDWRFTANYAYMEAKYKNFVDGRTDWSGYRLPWTPRHILNMEVAYAPKLGLGGRVTFRHEADMMYADTPLTYTDGTPITQRGVQVRPWKAPEKNYLDVQLSYKFNEKYKVMFDVKNVIGKTYEGYAYGREWDTGDYVTNWLNPRAFYLTLVMNWDAKE